MRNFIFFLLLLTIPACASSTDEPVIQKDFYPDGTLKSEWTYQDSVLDGVSKTYYPTGELHWKMPHSKGLLSSPYFEYYKDGAIRKEFRSNGITKSFYPGSELHWEVQQKDGKRNGPAKEYYRNGNLKQEIPYAQNKIVDGEYDIFYEDGSLRWKTKYKDGTPVGVGKQYDKNGTLVTEIQYINGPIQTVEKSFYRNGIVKYETNYLNSLPHGVSRDYDQTGQLLGSTAFNEGVVDGPVRSYNRAGTLLLEVIYKDGKPIAVSNNGFANENDGILRDFYEDGEPASEIPIKMGAINGEAKFYYLDRTTQLTAQYKDNLLDGITKHYTEDGFIEAERNYSNGIILNSRWCGNDLTLSSEITYIEGLPQQVKKYDVDNHIIFDGGFDEYAKFIKSKNDRF